MNLQVAGLVIMLLVISSTVGVVEAAEGFSLTTLWTQEVDQMDGSVFAASSVEGNLVVVANGSSSSSAGDRGGLVAVNANNGTIRWTWPGIPSPTTAPVAIARVLIQARAGRVLVQYTGAGIFGAIQVYCLDVMTGKQTYQFDVPNIGPGAEDHAVDYPFSKDGELFVFADLQVPVSLYCFNLSTGQMKWQNNNIAMFPGGIIGFSVGEKIVAALGGTAEGPTYASFDIETGAFICKVQQALVGGGFVQLGNGDIMIVPMNVSEEYGPHTLLEHAFDAVSVPSTNGSSSFCEPIGTFGLNHAATELGDNIFAVSLETGFVFHYEFAGGKNSTSKSGSMLWKSDRPIGQPTKAPMSLSHIPFNHEKDIAIFNVGGNFTAINISSGKTLWYAHHQVPWLPAGHGGSQIVGEQRQEIYPLGNGNLFIPNLQGYVIIHVSASSEEDTSVVTRDETTPISGAASSVNSLPFVVYADLKAGVIRAVEANPPEELDRR